MLRRGASREPGRREVERTPPEVDRALLADESAPKAFEDAVGMYEATPAHRRVDRVVRRVLLVLGERDGIGNLGGLGKDLDLDPPFAEPGDELAIEVGDGAGPEVHHERARLRIDDGEPVLDEV